jgi:hypothetical protein
MNLHEFISPGGLALLALGVADAAGFLPAWLAVSMAFLVLSGYLRHIRSSRP